MKLFLILISVLTIKSCNSSKQSYNTMDAHKEVKSLEHTITYKAITRGSFLHIEIKNDSVRIKKNRTSNSESTKMSKDQIDKLITLLSKLSIDSLTTLKPPSKAFQYDGAAIASLTIEYRGNTYQTPSFDHGNPPKEIELLVKYLLSFDVN